MGNGIKHFLLELFFPKFCFGCQREGDFLCQDCRATIDILNSHQKFKGEKLDDLYYAVDYKTFLIKNLIRNLKYEPFVKDIAKNLASLIIDHFQLTDNPPPFLLKKRNYILIPLPLEKRKLKWRGFNQTEEITKELSKFLKIPLLNDALIKIRKTLPQVELSASERKDNVKGVFSIKNPEKIREKKILLVDDIYTTGATMTECAKVLKEAGAREVIGMAVARAAPEEDSRV